MSTQLWTIVCKACRCSKPLNGWASQLFTTSKEPLCLKCLDEYVSAGEREQRTAVVRTLARQDKLKHLTSSVLAFLFRRRKFLAPTHCKTQIIQSGSSTLNFDAPASNYHQTSTSEEAAGSQRVESFPASIECHVKLANERVTKDPQRVTMSWNDDRGQSGKKQVSLDLEMTRSFSVSSKAAPVDGGHDIVRGTVINDELLAGQHGGTQTQRNNN